MFGLFSSAYKNLLNEEQSLPRPQGKVTMDTFMEIVKQRADFAKKVEKAFQNGDINKSQYDELITLNRKNALPG